MVKHEIELTDEENDILQAVSVNIEKPVAELLEGKATLALRLQLQQYLTEGCVNKVNNMTVKEKISFLNGV